MTTNTDLLFDQDGHVLVVTLNRPEARNALTLAMYDGLAQICVEPPVGIKAIIIRGAGDKAFAAGTDIRQFRDFKTPKQSIEYEQRIDYVLGAIETCAVPIIAALSGACTGGGAMIATVCDLRICSADLRMGFPIARTLGNSLSAASLARLGQILGPSRVRGIMFTSRLIESTEALQIGFVSEVLDDAETLFQRAHQLALALCEQAPLTLKATKILQHRLLMQQINNVEDEDMVQMCYQSEDFKHGLEAFLAKQKPQWKGK